MAKQKVLTLQEKNAIAMAQRMEQMKRELAEIAERKRLFEEQEAARIAALTPEELEAEEAANKEHEEAVRNIQIATAEARLSPIVHTGLRRPIHLQDGE